MCDLLYQVGGSQAYDAPSYVVRKADMEDLKELSQSELIWVHESKIRQSSLIGIPLRISKTTRTLEERSAPRCFRSSVCL